MNQGRARGCPARRAGFGSERTMATEHLELVRRCPACAAVVDRRELRCWLCQHVLAWRAPAAPSSRETPVARPPNSLHAFQFSLSSLFFFVTAIAIHLGVLAASPTLGLCLLVIGLPALARTSLHFSRLEVDRPTLAERSEAYVLSVICTLGGLLLAAFALATSVLVLSGALSIMELTGNRQLEDTALMIGMLLSLLAASVAFTSVYWWTLPPARRRNAGDE